MSRNFSIKNVPNLVIKLRCRQDTISIYRSIKSLARNLPSDSFLGIWMYFLPVTNQTSFTSKVTTAQRAFEVSVPLMDFQNVVLENRDGG